VPDFSGFVEFFRRIIGKLDTDKKPISIWNIHAGSCGYIDLTFCSFNAWLITVYRLRVFNGVLQHEHLSTSRNMTPEIVNLSYTRTELHASGVLFLGGIIPQWIEHCVRSQTVLEWVKKTVFKLGSQSARINLYISPHYSSRVRVCIKQFVSFLNQILALQAICFRFYSKFVLSHKRCWKKQRSPKCKRQMKSSA